MSLGYAEKLSYREDVGTVGMSEIFDPPEILQEKIEELAMIIQKSKHLVAFTGAGISTSCGIPDFRGPSGVWTLQRAGKGLPEASLPFDRAVPSLTHMALVELEKAGILKFVISQNVDGLHLRSGIPREKLAELHGNSFRETCPSCGVEYFRDFEIETIGMKETSRRCSNETCEAKLKDTVLDWEDALPPKEMNPAQKHCKMADVVLCLGTSLQITPACNLPLRCLRDGGKIVIVNLQPTPKDKKASLVIHGQVDKVSFPERPDLKIAILNEQPFLLKREMLKTRPFKMVLNLYFGDGCGCPCTKIEWDVDFQASIHIGKGMLHPWWDHHIKAWTTKPWDHHAMNPVNHQRVRKDDFSHDKDAVLQKLRNVAIQDSCCGQYAAVERKFILESKSEETVYAIVTNISKDKSSSSLDPITKINGKTTRRSRTTQGGIGGATTIRAVWNPLADQLLASVLVDYMIHAKKSMGEWFDSNGWSMIASEFNRRNGSTYNVNQLKKRFSSLKRIYKSINELLSLSGFGWDESSKLVVAELAVWDNHLQNHPKAAQFQTTAFPAYEQMSIICGDSKDAGNFDKSQRSIPTIFDTVSMSSSPPWPEMAQPDEVETSPKFPAEANSDFIVQVEGDVRTPQTRRKRPLTPSYSHCSKSERARHIGSDISDSLCKMDTTPEFMSERRTSHSLPANDYSIANCVKELMKIEPLNPIARVIASRHFENAHLREMFMVWGKEERVAWLEMIMKEN